MYESWPHLKKKSDPGRVADHGVFTDMSTDEIPAKCEWNVIIITYYAPGEVTASVAANNCNFREQIALERLSFSLVSLRKFMHLTSCRLKIILIPLFNLGSQL